jgi:mRNA interferase MazF
MIRRGDVVLIKSPYAGGGGAKHRPGLVVQCDANNSRLLNTIVAAISSNTRLAGSEPTQLLIDPATSSGAGSGLLHPSAVKCENLYTAAQSEIRRTIGHLRPDVMAKVDACLRAALEV